MYPIPAFLALLAPLSLRPSSLHRPQPLHRRPSVFCVAQPPASVSPSDIRPPALPPFPAPFAPASAGEWFGFEVAFSMAGVPQPLPDFVVPDEFRNWDVQLFGYETVTSTRVYGDEVYLKRTRALPSVGCEADAVVPEERVERFVTGAVEGKVGGSVGFESGAFSAGPEVFLNFFKAVAWLADPEAGQKRVRLEFGDVRKETGAVVAFVEGWDGEFCDGALLPGCGGNNVSFAEEVSMDAGVLEGRWKVKGTALSIVEGSWVEEVIDEEVVRSRDDVESEARVCLPRGISLGVLEKESGEIELCAGWILDSSRSVVRRSYGSDGKLLRVVSGVEMKMT